MINRLDYFAGKVMSTMKIINHKDPDIVVEFCYDIAELMIKESDRRYNEEGFKDYKYED